MAEHIRFLKSDRVEVIDKDSPLAGKTGIITSMVTRPAPASPETKYSETIAVVKFDETADSEEFTDHSGKALAEQLKRIE